MSRGGAIFGAIVAGVVVGSALTYTLSPQIAHVLGVDDSTTVQETGPKEKKPLYWVAPMDPNYRRDKPGKSPMGMDLIPVFEKGGAGADTGPGTVQISPDVVNNLGVTTATAEMKSMQHSIQTVGYVQYDQDQLVHIHPRVQGWVEKLYVKASGDPVTKGQPLYDIYSPELVNAQEELMLALERSKPRLIAAAENRLRSLRVPQDIIDRLRQDRVVSQTVTFRAPMGGVVDNLEIRQGFFVKPGSTLMSIGTLDQVWVEAEVFERQAAEVSIGQPVIMNLDFLPGKEYKGVVDYIYPTLDPKTRTLRVRLRFANKDNLLKPNMFAQVVIMAVDEKKSLLVPKTAVIRSGHSNRVVLAREGGHFKSVNVTVGRWDDSSVEILSGLNKGDLVVTSAQFLIDSESSKTSDFKRMNHQEKVLPKTVWVGATINSIMVDHRMINVSHLPIKEWEWPEMTMDFQVVEGVDFASLKKGMKLHIEITRTGENQYEVTKVHIPSADDGKRKLDELELDDMSLDDLSLSDKKTSDNLK